MLYCWEKNKDIVCSVLSETKGYFGNPFSGVSRWAADKQITQINICFWSVLSTVRLPANSHVLIPSATVNAFWRNGFRDLKGWLYAPLWCVLVTVNAPSQVGLALCRELENLSLGAMAACRFAERWNFLAGHSTLRKEHRRECWDEFRVEETVCCLALLNTEKISLHRQDSGWVPKRTNGEKCDWAPKEMIGVIPWEQLEGNNCHLLSLKLANTHLCTWKERS